jgi:hypothetical protein
MGCFAGPAAKNPFIKRRIISLTHSSILQRIWLNFMALGFFFRLFDNFQVFCFGFPTFFGLSITEETLLVEMRIWCIKSGIRLVLH